MKRVCEPGLCELFGCEPRVFQKKIFGQYAGGGVFCHFFKQFLLRKNIKGGGAKILKFGLNLQKM